MVNMHIWKIDGVNDGIWVTSDSSTNYDLVPEGGNLRVINLDTDDGLSFTIDNIDSIVATDKIIINMSDGDTLSYSVGLDSDDLSNLSNIDSNLRNTYISSITNEVALWLVDNLRI